MTAIFTYDWFTGSSFQRQRDEARDRCARKKFPHLSPDQAANDPHYQAFHSALEVRTLIYLRDGFSYEMKELVDVGLAAFLPSSVSRWRSSTRWVLSWSPRCSTRSCMGDLRGAPVREA